MLEQLKHIYGLLRLYVSLFQPLMKLKEKTRAGARVRKAYDSLSTLCRRLLVSPDPSPEMGQEPS